MSFPGNEILVDALIVSYRVQSLVSSLIVRLGVIGP